MISYGFMDYASPEYDLFVRLRYQVLRQPLDLEFTEDQISQEWDQYHLGAFNEYGLIIGGLTLQKLSSGIIKMRQVAVDENFQGKGVGASLVIYSEHWARTQGFHKIVLHARSGVVDFYQKLGYLSVGDHFIEVGILHQAMEKAI
ncbi:MAG: GNAT family N-acetyltransferase [Saprospiraceae bacterium]|nr:GNAT family N-acetyltransferase [Candidatus Vicinibacter affinis]